MDEMNLFSSPPCDSRDENQSFDKEKEVMETHTIMLSPIRKVAAPRNSSQPAAKRTKKPSKLKANLAKTPPVNRKIVPTPPAKSNISTPLGRGLVEDSLQFHSLAGSSGVFNFGAADLATAEEVADGIANLAVPPNTPQDDGNFPGSMSDMNASAGNKFIHPPPSSSANLLKRRRTIYDVDGLEHDPSLFDGEGTDCFTNSSDSLPVFEDDTALPRTRNPWTLRDKPAPHRKQHPLSSSPLGYGTGDDLLRPGPSTTPSPRSVCTPTRTAISKKIVKGWIVNDEFQDDREMWDILEKFGERSSPEPEGETSIISESALMPFATPEKASAPADLGQRNISPLSLGRSTASDKENIDPLDPEGTKYRRRSLPLPERMAVHKKRRTRTAASGSPLPLRFSSDNEELALPLRQPSIFLRQRRATLDLSITGTTGSTTEDFQKQVPSLFARAGPRAEQHRMGRRRTVLGELNGLEKGKGVVPRAEKFKFSAAHNIPNDTGEDEEMLL